MKPNLLTQIALVVLSLILLVVAVLLPKRTEEVATTISIELNGERVVLEPTKGGRTRPAAPEPPAQREIIVLPEATPAPDPAETTYQ